MNEIIRKIEKKILVSCQSGSREPIHEENCIGSIIRSVILGGAAGLRLAGKDDIRLTRTFSELPVIGITKPDPLPHNWKKTAYITTTFSDAQEVSEAGANIIAIDGTSRKRPGGNLAELIYKVKTDLNKPVMADISTFEEGVMCALLGADIVSTTLSGYTEETLENDNGKPDFNLLEKLIKALNIPVILEGRIWQPDQVKKAFELGAYSVVIGSAITRPQVITKRFIDLSS